MNNKTESETCPRCGMVCNTTMMVASLYDNITKVCPGCRFDEVDDSHHKFTYQGKRYWREDISVILESGDGQR